jgi:RimJ/RimL family protein N-acetyltransferase
MRDLTRWQPSLLPQRIGLQGAYCRLEPLSLTHADQLYSASMAPGYEDRFRFLLVEPGSRDAFDHWLEKAIQTDDPLTFAVIDQASGCCEGRQSLMRIKPERGSIEIGSILWGPRISRTRVATESLYLMARYVFETLGYRRFEWKCDSQNLASRAAAARFGFKFEGIFRQHMIVKGRNRDTAWYSLLDGEWPSLRVAYDAWLSPENFDSAGLQIRRLQQFVEA